MHHHSAAIWVAIFAGVATSFFGCFVAVFVARKNSDN